MSTRTLSNILIYNQIFWIDLSTGYLFHQSKINPESLWVHQPIGQLIDQKLTIKDLKSERYPLLNRTIKWFNAFEDDRD